MAREPIVEVPGEMRGCIYVINSLSTKPNIAGLRGNLFKIGFTKQLGEERFKNVKDDPTFLMADVHLLRTYHVNVKPNKMENLLHRFFGPARLDIEVMDRFGKPRRVTEWFFVPIAVVEEAVSMLIDGRIVDYRYDLESQKIVPIEKVT